MTDYAAKTTLEASLPAPAQSPALSVDFTALYQRHRDLVYRLALRYGAGRQAWAEDIVQDVFIAALEHPSFGAGQCEPAAWLYRVTTNRCVTRLKRERLFQLISGLIRGARGVEQRTPERVCDGHQALTAIDRWFDQLPPAEKAVFAMSVHDGKTQVEIARMLGLSKGYVSKLLARAQAKLDALDGGDHHHD